MCSQRNKFEAYSKSRRLPAKEKCKTRERNACRCADYDVLLIDLQESNRQVTIRDQSIDELRSTIEWLEELLQDSDTLQTKDGKAYTSELKML